MRSSGRRLDRLGLVIAGQELGHGAAEYVGDLGQRADGRVAAGLDGVDRLGRKPSAGGKGLLGETGGQAARPDPFSERRILHVQNYITVVPCGQGLSNVISYV